jgi:CRP-like cAMP-binding protein
MDASALGKLYADGEVVVRQGDTGDCMYTVQEGQLEVVAKQGDRGEVRIAVMEQGAIFGEMAIFEHEVRSATVRALGPARVLTIDKKTFLRRVQEDPSLAFNLVRIMSQRIRKLSAQSGERRAGADRRHQQERRRGDRRGRKT